MESERTQNKLDDSIRFRYDPNEIIRSLDYMQNAITTVCEMFDLTEEQIKSKNRKRNIITARQFIFKFCKTNTRASLSWLGASLGKDHATVLHSIRCLDNVCVTDIPLKSDYYSFETLCKLKLAKKYGDIDKIFSSTVETEYVVQHRKDPYKRIIFSGYTTKDIMNTLDTLAMSIEDFKIDPFSTSGLKIIKLN